LVTGVSILAVKPQLKRGVNGVRRLSINLALVTLTLVLWAATAQALNFNASLKQSLPQADKFTRIEDINKYRTTDQPLKTVKAVYIAYNGDKQIGAVVYVAPNGYKSEIHSLVAMDMKGTVLKTVVFLHHETAAFVGPLKKGSFQKQFDGVTLADKLSLVFRQPTRRGEVQAITEASTTSEALALGVSEARHMFTAIYNP
jgi:electron transport complex protein RnfG